jgi:hypothetical protein
LLPTSNGEVSQQRSTSLHEPRTIFHGQWRLRRSAINKWIANEQASTN